jgi:hypothetical protein
VSDGKTFAAQRSPDGEYRFIHGDHALFHLSADLMVLTGAAGETRDLGWWRILLDSVLFTVSLLRGSEALHGGAVATSSGAVAVAAISGTGTGTLLGQLVRDGHQLVTDDILALAVEEERVLAQPGPPLMTLPRERAAGVGTALGEVGGEVWAAVPVVARPLSLRRIVLLNRRAGAKTGMFREQHPLAPLLAHLLKFPRTHEREIARFLLASTVATQTEICRLDADLAVRPQQLAALALDGLAA